MPYAALVAALLVVADLAAFWLLLVARLRSTDRSLLRPWPLRRLLRWYRARWLRVLLWFPSWPHALNRLLPRPPRQTMATPARELWRSGRATITRVERLPDRYAGREPVLLVHSLVTKPWILDLLPGRSLVGGLRDAGLDVLVLDWGDPERRAAGRAGWDAAAATLAAAIDAVAAFSPTRRVHVIGYCMGATLALAHVAERRHRQVASLTLIAPPVDTAVPGGMGDVLRSPTLMPVLGLDGSTRMPPWVLREAFHALRRKTLKSAVGRLRRWHDRDFQQVAGALDRWAWRQRPLSGALSFDLVDYYRANPFVSGRTDLRRVRLPVLVAVTDRDHIVPIASSLALTRLLPAPPEVVRCPAGHVSMLMGAESRTTLLPRLTAFLREHGA